MDIEVTRSRHITVIAPRGDLDTAGAGPIKRTFQELLDQGTTRLVVDLQSVGYVDSRGLGELVAAMKRARQAGGDLCLSTPRGEVRQILEMTRLSEGMSVYETRDEALAAWDARA